MVNHGSAERIKLGPTKHLTGLAAAGLGGAIILSGMAWAGLIALIAMLLN